MNMNTDTVSSRLKMARFLAGYKSAKSFTEQHDLAYITYSQHEAGKRGLNAETAIRYCALLSINLEWLLTGKGDQTGNSSGGRRSLNAFAQAANRNESLQVESEKATYTAIVRKSIDRTLFLSIVEKLHSMLQDSDIDMDWKEAIGLSIDIYDDIMQQDVDDAERNRIINLSVAAVRLGLLSRVD